jgi:DNA-binding transcriptional MocR family regulator
MDAQPLYRQLADHYLGAIKAGSLAVGERMPSVRAMMRAHGVSLSTALQTCRELERQGWVEARPRSGYFVRAPRRAALELPQQAAEEPGMVLPPDPAQYVGIHARVSDFVLQGQVHAVKVNLSGARGAPELYPAEQLKSAAIRALRHDPDVLVRSTPPGGNLRFRAALAKHMLGTGIVCSPEDVTITHGCIEALNLALRAVAQPGDTIAIESPTYYGLFQVLESLGLRALEIPTSANRGISVDALELAIRTYGNIKAVVVVPHLQNPLGAILPDSKKRRLVDLCEEHGIALIEDDIYGDLADMTDTDRPLQSLKALDRSGNVIYCSSLHKSLAPGMRLGWILGGRWHTRVAMFKYAQSRHNEEWPQIAATEFIASGAFDRHLRRLRSTLRGQRDRTAEAIADYFPQETRLTVPNGGPTLWVELPHKLSSKRLFDAAIREGMLFVPGSLFSNSDRFDHCLRLSCGNPYSKDIDWALRRLGQLVEQLARTASNEG